MAKRIDAQKRAEWHRRLERFEESGRTIAQFCLHENIPPHRFYYWARRLRSKSSRRQHSSLAESAKKDSRAQVHPQVDGDAWEGSSERMVRFHWNSKLQVAIPADCLDTIRCVLDYATHVEGLEGSTPASTFRQVIIG